MAHVYRTSQNNLKDGRQEVNCHIALKPIIVYMQTFFTIEVTEVADLLFLDRGVDDIELFNVWL